MGAPLAANRTEIGPWESFGLIDLGNGEFALRAYTTGKYVCFDNYGTERAVANRTAIGDWEKFTLRDVDLETIALRAFITDNYLRYDTFIPNQYGCGPGVWFYRINIYLR
jgi:hypothetical protein